MVQLFYGTFLTEGVREGKLSALTVSSRLVTVSVLIVEKAFESGISRSEYWFTGKPWECLDPQSLHL